MKLLLGQKKTKHELKSINYEAGLYFNLRYRALPDIFSNKVKWDIGELFNFEEHYQDWRKKKTPINRSTAKAALRLSFYLECRTTLSSGTEQSLSK